MNRQTIRLQILFVCAFLVTGCSDRFAPPGYVGGRVCADCHEQEYVAWQGSDHDLAMDRANESTVLGNFDNSIFVQSGDTTRFFRSNESYFVETTGLDARKDTFRIDYVFGVRPLQQYLIPMHGGRLQALTVAWDVPEQRWFSLYPGAPVEPGEFVHWTGRGMTWNYMCAECHSTSLKKAYDLSSDSYSTTYSEIDVSCETCHGPGEMHLVWAARRERGEVWADSTMGLTVRLNRWGASTIEIETCAPCHSRRTTLDASFKAGDRYLDHYAPSLLDEGLYFADGQIQDEVYVYGSFLQSKMYRRGVRCSNCHDPHTARVRFDGNTLCAQCHDPAIYDQRAHVRHLPNTPAALCVTCHMPERTYMQVDPRRDHAMKVPRPALSARIGSSDVCVACHPERSVHQLTADIDGWYGGSKYFWPDSVLAADAIVAGRLGRPEVLDGLIGLARDTSYSDIYRATALSLLGSYPVEQVLGSVSVGLRDSAPLIRIGALRAADVLGRSVTSALISPLVRDSIRWVRAEAARLLVMMGVDPITDSIDGFAEALDDYEAFQQTTEDQPGAHVNLAVVAESLGDDPTAESEYQTALRLDSTFTPAHLNLALLLNRQRMSALQIGNTASATELGRRAEAEFKLAIRTGPDSLADAHYMLGLLLAEYRPRLPEAAAHLERAARILRTNPRMFYNAGLAFQQLSEVERAEVLLREAINLDSENPDYLNALVILYMQQERWVEALRENELLQKIVPENAEINQRGAYLAEQSGVTIPE